MKKKLLCLLFAAFMMLAMVGTGCNGDKPDSPGDDGSPRRITVGTWFDVYYTSAHTSPYDNPEVTDPDLAQMQIDNMRAIEERYNVRFEFVNLTWNGVQESIATSIMAGMPDCDIYQADLQFGIPTVLSGLAIGLESEAIGLDQTADVFSDMQVMRALNLNQPETYLFASSLVTALDVYPLSFNLDMIKANNLENPQDLWDRGEWTWDKWREYLRVLTDTDRGIYGWSGYWNRLLENLLFSNDTTIASGPRTTVTDSRTIQVFQLIYDIYNTDRTGRPWDDSDWDINNNLYAEGRSGFFIGADWLFGEQGGAELPFEIGVVPWPIGPSGNKDTNFHGAVGGNWYFIPRGVENPRLVYDVMYDWMNWYNYEVEIAVDMEWTMNRYMTERNFEYAFMMNQKTGFDIWNNLGLGDDFSMEQIMDGEMTAAQYAATVEQIIQDALDNFF
ncbi:MAG: extracellular solute-binding protein [Oscillospiraceae bacterium]|jgi:hypothetical protein|nr:extracellular solute-binding protein [Oscillospiraceae bacterium]